MEVSVGKQGVKQFLLNTDAGIWLWLQLTTTQAPLKEGSKDSTYFKVA